MDDYQTIIANKNRYCVIRNSRQQYVLIDTRAEYPYIGLFFESSQEDCLNRMLNADEQGWAGVSNEDGVFWYYFHVDTGLTKGIDYLD